MLEGPSKNSQSTENSQANRRDILKLGLLTAGMMLTNSAALKKVFADKEKVEAILVELKPLDELTYEKAIKSHYQNNPEAALRAMHAISRVMIERGAPKTEEEREQVFEAIKSSMCDPSPKISPDSFKNFCKRMGGAEVFPKALTDAIEYLGVGTSVWGALGNPVSLGFSALLLSADLNLRGFSFLTKSAFKTYDSDSLDRLFNDVTSLHLNLMSESPEYAKVFYDFHNTKSQEINLSLLPEGHKPWTLSPQANPEAMKEALSPEALEAINRLKASLSTEEQGKTELSPKELRELIKRQKSKIIPRFDVVKPEYEDYLSFKRDASAAVDLLNIFASKVLSPKEFRQLSQVLNSSLKFAELAIIANSKNLMKKMNFSSFSIGAGMFGAAFSLLSSFISFGPSSTEVILEAIGDLAKFVRKGFKNLSEQISEGFISLHEGQKEIIGKLDEIYAEVEQGNLHIKHKLDEVETQLGLFFDYGKTER